MVAMWRRGLSAHARFRLAGLAALALLLAGCAAKGDVSASPDSGAPPETQVIHDGNSGIVRVDRPEQFPLASARAISVAPELNATGVVTADVSRNVPVISLASGRIVEIRKRLGDAVEKGELLMRVQSPEFLR